MVECPHCKDLSSDIEFCDSCGKMIEFVEDIFVDEKTEKYTGDTLACTTVLTYLTNEQLVKLDVEEGLIQYPIKIEEDLDIEERSKVYFLDNQEINLSTYLEQHTLSFENILSIINRVKKILCAIQDKGYILGTVCLDEFFLYNNNLDTLFLRQLRPFFKKEAEIPRFIIGEIYSPELVNKDLKLLGPATDVYVFGQIVLNLICHKNVKLEEYEHSRYVIYQLQLFNSQVPRTINSWLSQTTSLFVEQRFPDIASCMNEFERLLALHESLNINSDDILEFISAAVTDVGVGKLELKKESGNVEKANEDSFVKLISEDGSKQLFIVADGISNCSLGSGYDASHILTEVTTTRWQLINESIRTKEDVIEFISDIIKESNEKIFEAIEAEYSDDIYDIMGTTLCIGIIINQTFYYSSVGDSLLYLLRDQSLIPLTIEDNVGNKCLKDGMSWTKYLENEDKNSLTHFIGGELAIRQVKEGSMVEFTLNEFQLKLGDLIVMCSDGLTDYLTPLNTSDETWIRDQKLRSILINPTIESLEQLNSELLELANLNGGGDNITVILIQAIKGEMNSNEIENLPSLEEEGTTNTY